MISYHPYAALTAARRDTLLAEAEAYRLAKPARSTRQRADTSAAGSSRWRRLLGRWALRREPPTARRLDRPPLAGEDPGAERLGAGGLEVAPSGKEGRAA